MKEGFTFNKVSLMFLRKVIFNNFGGGGGNRKEPKCFVQKYSTKKNQKLGTVQKSSAIELLQLILVSLIPTKRLYFSVNN